MLRFVHNTLLPIGISKCILMTTRRGNLNTKLILWKKRDGSKNGEDVGVVPQKERQDDLAKFKLDWHDLERGDAPSTNPVRRAEVPVFLCFSLLDSAQQAMNQFEL